MAARRRFPAFDALRAGAMALGLVLHAGVPYTQRCPDSWAICDPSRSGVFDLANTLIHAARMPVFFVMSGFFAALLIARIGQREFLLHRLRRIGLPCLLACGLLVPITRAVWIYGAFGRPEGAVGGRFVPSLRAHFETEGFAVFETIWHLWFLEYLLLLTLAFVALRALLATRTLPPALSAPLVARGRAFWLAIPTGCAMATMQGWNVDGVSRLVPAPHMLAYYGLFFAAGVGLYRERDRLAGLARDWWLHLAAAVGLVLPVMMGLAQVFGGMPPVWVDVVGRALSALLTCLLLFGFVGLFVEQFQVERPLQRYLADAAYFIYLVHFPLVAFLGIGVAHLALPAVVKFMLVLGLAIPLLLVTYHCAVRYRGIGKLLHGPRSRAVTG